jgi:hypothetical protein
MFPLNEFQNDYVGLFIVRDGAMLQSVVDLYTGPYMITVGQIRAGQLFMDSAGIGPQDALLPISTQSRRICRYMQKALTVRGGEAVREFTYVVGGKSKLFEQLVYRYNPAISHGLRVVDHVDALFTSSASRTISLVERNTLSELEFIKMFLGAADENWFQALCSELEPNTTTQ